MNIWNALLQLLYPERCACCRVLTGGDIICEACKKKLEPLDEPEFYARHSKGAGGIIAGFSYTGTGAQLMQDYKFDGKVRCYEPMRPRFEELVAQRTAHEHIDAVTCVPMHRRALAKRGFNQAERIARSLAKRMQRPYEELLEKQCKNKTQHKLSAAERAENVKSVYAAYDEAKGKTVLLVDDIATTGATLSACATALMDAGAKRVICAAVLAAPEHRAQKKL